MISPLYYTLTPNGYKVSFQYHPMLVKCIKRIPSARYHAADKIWEVSKNDIVYLQKMGEWARNNHFVSTIYWLHDDEGINTYEPLPLPELSVPHNLLIEPYDYQKQGIAYALEKKRCILGDEQGLGKTIEAIGLLTASNALPALVICPASLKINWQRELKKFGGLSAVILNDKNRAVFPHYWQTKKRDGRALGEVFICNYESLRKFFVTRVKREGRFTMKSIEFNERIKMFRSVIIDESHKCKNKGTQQSKFV